MLQIGWEVYRAALGLAESGSIVAVAHRTFWISDLFHFGLCESTELPSFQPVAGYLSSLLEILFFLHINSSTY